VEGKKFLAKLASDHRKPNGQLVQRLQTKTGPSCSHAGAHYNREHVRYLGFEVDDALAIAEQVDVRTIIGVLTAFFNFSD